MTALLELREVGCSYGEHEALAGVDLTVREGECWSVVGPNGAGKTTLLRIAAGLLAPSRGELRWRGRRAQEGLGGTPATRPQKQRAAATVTRLGAGQPADLLRDRVAVAERKLTVCGRRDVDDPVHEDLAAEADHRSG